MPSKHIDLGMIPLAGSVKPKPPPDPTIANILHGLDMFWSELDATKGRFELSSSLLRIPYYDIGEEYEEATMRSLDKKGWRRHPLGGTLWGGTL